MTNIKKKLNLYCFYINFHIRKCTKIDNDLPGKLSTYLLSISNFLLENFLKLTRINIEKIKFTCIYVWNFLLAIFLLPTTS